MGSVNRADSHAGGLEAGSAAALLGASEVDRQLAELERELDKRDA